MRKSTAFFIFITANLAVMAALYIHSLTAVSKHPVFKKEIKEIAEKLRLTDLVLSTDARYTRHPSQADLFSAFQDFPGSIEHFPTGSVIPPPDFSYMRTEIRIYGN
ncbi:MAG: hypothetical protein COW90_05550 [Nitrospirae bacterium CG22_combo_CG10-13_8_21_14_all_44_11]|nr:hypothetical protein [Nitrospirota bacterium]PIP70389.1 MAG: hypothetical protein COW90_05550 [Nitrospirae bacterium CG22_combo_CG10-13_8_21_14_all_44_11]PIV43078.1 MAG: hypothetical protein COS28_02535 [Nitrospirae bacterium CG02_land_8_20_14_3_00_44_33]PIV65904.1 MAG: hypothetical protein COS10_09010 [Nitrospirae bacterium CG01_land_8_20_14_3_00_44_22]PJA82378.1 MAG: hypothetical protein CO147_04990 [Nitrospirae bacterium CG_4_9_14_3_um_filter_44_28]